MKKILNFKKTMVIVTVLFVAVSASAIALTSANATSTSSTSWGCPHSDCPSTGWWVPDCPLDVWWLTILIPHPTDCHWFFQCSNGIAYCRQCPAGLHFDASRSTCTWPDMAGCADYWYRCPDY